LICLCEDAPWELDVALDTLEGKALEIHGTGCLKQFPRRENNSQKTPHHPRREKLVQALE
jgi:hypothetical protein